MVLSILLSISVYASSTKRDLYFSSCIKNYIAAVKLVSYIQPDKIDKSAKNMCDIAATNWDEHNAWSEMKYPEWQGCTGAMNTVYATDFEPNYRRKKTFELVDKFCVPIGKR